MIYYDLEISGKDVKRFIRNLAKMNINLYIITYLNKKAIIKVNRKDYLKINSLKTIYNIKIVKYYGLAKYSDFLNTYKHFLLILVLGFCFFLFLTNIIFEIDVNTNNKLLKEIVLSELSDNGIKKYKFVCSFNKKEKIKRKILSKYKDKIEWLEIKRIGTKYLVEIEERKENNKFIDENPRNIVAKKSGIITKINSTTGEIIGKIDQYVKKGDILISGSIYKNEDIVGTVRADGKVFAETWYTVSVSLPYHYKEENKTNRYENIININFLNKNIKLFDFKHFNNYNSKKLFKIKNFILPISISLDKLEETSINEGVYTIDNAYFKASEIAKKKLLNSLDKDSKIIFEKKLKTNEINSKIEVVIFYKVIEDITDYSYIEINQDNNEEIG
jgi:similar to stage IV sporulation protein